MKVLNIHGYKGKSNNGNFRILTEAGYTVSSLQLDYDASDLESIYNRLVEEVESFHPDIIVATSFGSFFAKHISLNFNIPCILVNPCLRPEISLRRIAPEFFDSTREEQVTRWVEEHKGTYKNDYIICGTADEVIDHTITASEIGKGAIHCVPGGNHSVDESLYRDHILRGISIAIRRTCT